MTHTNLIVDVNNLVFSLRHAKLHKTRKERFAKQILFKESIKSIIVHCKKLKADAIVLCVDSPNVWRKDIYPEYKSNRTESFEDVHFQDVIDASEMLLEFFRDYTAAFVLKVDRAEADDLIGVWCQESEGVENIIFSTDTDFVQLLSKTTKLYSHVQNVFRETEDPAYSLFVKCIRGDSKDFIRSAYPRVHETKLKKAWEDDIDMLNLLEFVRKDGVKVGDALTLNMKLIDLSMQPEAIRGSIINKIIPLQTAEYKVVSAMKYFGDCGMKESTDVLNICPKALKTKPIFKLSK